MNYTSDIQKILRIVCAETKQEPADVLVKSRKRELVYSRQLAMAMCLEFTKATQHFIGKFFARDHSTVIHCKKTVANMCDTSRVERERVERLRKRIRIALMATRSPKEIIQNSAIPARLHVAILKNQILKRDDRNLLYAISPEAAEIYTIMVTARATKNGKMPGSKNYSVRFNPKSIAATVKQLPL